MRKFNNLYCVYIVYETKNKYSNRKGNTLKIKENKDNKKRDL